jgi:ribosome-associated translation inhibitor RaiA
MDKILSGIVFQMNHPRSGKKDVSSIRSIRLVLEKIEKELVKESGRRSKHDDIITKKKKQGEPR